jgi:hypothetical protein
MSRSILVRSAIVQTVLVAALSIALVIPLGEHFFKHWGWLIGPIAWIACAMATARIVHLPRTRTLVGAVLAGIPSLLFVIVGLHTVGDVVAIILFAVWCSTGRPSRRSS